MRHKGIGAALGWLMLMMLAPLSGAHAAGSGGLGPSRVDFDDRLVKGQRSNSGGIYIFARQSVELKDMVQKPRSYRQRIIKTVFED